MMIEKGEKNAIVSVDDYMRELVHPLKSEIQAVREIIRAADPRIAESIKWNAPSFSCMEHFATFNPHSKDGVQVIFHLGAKAKDDTTIRQEIGDASGLLQWLAHDRAAMKFKDTAAIDSNRVALQAIVRQWIRYLR